MLKRVVLAIAVLCLCTAAVQAQVQTLYSVRASGNYASAMVGIPELTIPIINVTVGPTNPFGVIFPEVIMTQSGSGYFVVWGWCDTANNYCATVYGVAPNSAIQSQGLQVVKVNVDISMLTNKYACVMSGSNITCGDTPSLPPFTPTAFTGTFTSNVGDPNTPISAGTSSQGSVSTQIYIPALSHLTLKTSINGLMSLQTATFTGSVGPVSVNNFYSGITMMRGLGQIQLTVGY